MSPSLFKNQTGAAAVELALLLPFLALLILGTVDMASLMYNKQILTNASREGARKAIARREDQATAKLVAVNYCGNNLINWGGGDNFITMTAKNPNIVEVSVKEYRLLSIEFVYNYLIDGFFGLSIGPTTLSGETLMWRERGEE